MRVRVLTSVLFFFKYSATPEIYTLSLHDALPISSTLSNEPESEVIEIRNHLLSNYFLSNLVELEREINLNDIKNIQRIILKDTPKDQYKIGNNEILHAGEFRKVNVFANGSPLTIYPVSSGLLFL